MTEGNDAGIEVVDELAAEYERRAEMLRRVGTRVDAGSVASVTVGLCLEALHGARGGASDALVRVEAEQLAAAVAEVFGTPDRCVRYLMESRPPVFAGRTPVEVIAAGEVALLRHSLAAMQHGLGA